MQRIIIFASGSGTNAERIAEYFKENTDVEVSAIFSNNTKAGVLERAKRLHISALTFNREAFYKTSVVRKILQTLQPDMIVLAGFLWKFPQEIIEDFPNQIINIHPALLPKYGGKGMYGMKVHQAVIENNESESGISIHYVNENYDEGGIILQEKIQINEEETPETLAQKIHKLEYEFFPKVIEELLNKK